MNMSRVSMPAGEVWASLDGATWEPIGTTDAVSVQVAPEPVTPWLVGLDLAALSMSTRQVVVMNVEPRSRDFAADVARIAAMYGPQPVLQALVVGGRRQVARLRQRPGGLGQLVRVDEPGWYRQQYPDDAAAEPSGTSFWFERRYRQRVEQARDRRRFAELNRRDRRRRRKGRVPIGPEVAVVQELRIPRVRLERVNSIVRMVSEAADGAQASLSQLGAGLRRVGEDIARMQEPLLQRFADLGQYAPLPVLTAADLVGCGCVYCRASRSRGPDVTHYDRRLGDGALRRDETSGPHSSDSSGGGAVWSDLMARIDDLVGEEDGQ